MQSSSHQAGRPERSGIEQLRELFLLLVIQLISSLCLLLWVDVTDVVYLANDLINGLADGVSSSEI